MSTHRPLLAAALAALLVLAGCQSSQVSASVEPRSPGTLASLETNASSTQDRERPNLDVPYVPTPDAVVAEMLRMAAVGNDDVVYDLGCGDGRIVIAAIRDKGAKRGVGVDIDPQRIRESNENAKRAGVTDRVTFIQEDLFKVPIKDATAVLIYLLPEINLRLKPTLFRDLQPGVRVVSHDFDMGPWEPDERKEVEASRTHRLYMWIIPADAKGTWNLTAGNQSAKLNLEQEFQMVRGTLSIGGQDLKVKGRLRGAELHLETEAMANPGTFKGRVNGTNVEGELTFADGALKGQHSIRGTRG